MESNNFYKKVYNDLYDRGYHSKGTLTLHLTK